MYNINRKAVCIILSKFEILPRIYTALPAENEELKEKLREEAQAQFLHVCEFCRFIIGNYLWLCQSLRGILITFVCV